MSYIYGFLASGSVYILLHRSFPSPTLDSFVNGSMPAERMMVEYRGKWEDVGYENLQAASSDGSVGKQMEESVAPVSVV
jgi:hypothetical protein